MEVFSFTISELSEISKNEWFQTSANLPITLHRAVSQSKNPRAEQNDLALLVAVENKEVVCYVGMIPDYFFINEQKIKMAWGSTGWVREDYKPTGIYVILLFKAMEFYKGKFAIAEVSDSAKMVFEKSKKFIQLKELSSTTVVCRFCSEGYLINKSRKFAIILPALKLCDFVGNLFVNSFSFNRVKKYESNLRFQEILETDNEAERMIEKFSANNFCRRSVAEINWILNYPWVLQDKVKTEENKKYFFSSTARFFSIKLFKLFNKENLIAILLIKQRDNHISIPYSWFEKEQTENVVKALYLFTY
ncbi:MAG: hypothetical protein JXR58_10175, partial [Bacteroidales bacterium]|nr:hypothetical protein [Bacteroidales bacterium]